MTKILLAEDHAIVRQGLSMFLSVQAGFEVVGETGDGAAVEGLVDTLQPDVLLLDLDLPGCHGLVIAQRMQTRTLAPKTIALTGEANERKVREALATGIDGYVLKHADGAELLEALHTVVRGGHYVSKKIADLFVQEGLEASAGAAAPLTAREQEIVCMIARGLRNEEIAQAINRSVLTVRKHRQNLMEKLQLRNAVEVAAYATRHGL